MKIQFWSIGRKNERQYDEAINDFTQRISRYFPVEWKLFPSAKSNDTNDITQQKHEEAQVILNALKPDCILITLDERGQQLTSEKLASLLQNHADSSIKNLVFLIGGAYGVDKSLLARSTFIWSLSSLVFPHQLVRLILSEQIYRACTINRNEKYHHT
ncbi:MAG: 23S rRNA (pseudouridine(1915)-N(3))-methyltransferase RlmH [Ginsengibacter sp.]